MRNRVGLFLAASHSRFGWGMQAMRNGRQRPDPIPEMAIRAIAAAALTIVAFLVTIEAARARRSRWRLLQSREELENLRC